MQRFRMQNAGAMGNAAGWDGMGCALGCDFVRRRQIVIVPVVLVCVSRLDVQVLVRVVEPSIEGLDCSRIRDGIRVYVRLLVAAARGCAWSAWSACTRSGGWVGW